MADAEEITGEMRRKLLDTIPVVAACASLEAELSAMEPQDRAAFMEEYGVTESLRGPSHSTRVPDPGPDLILHCGGGRMPCVAYPERHDRSRSRRNDPYGPVGEVHTGGDGGLRRLCPIRRFRRLQEGRSVASRRQAVCGQRWGYNDHQSGELGRRTVNQDTEGLRHRPRGACRSMRASALRDTGSNTRGKRPEVCCPLVSSAFRSLSL